MSSSVYRGYSSIDVKSVNTECYDVELVERDLLNHFRTRLGSRRGRPLFGSIIHDLIMENFDDRTERLVRADAKRIIGAEPRVRTLKQEVILSPDTHTIIVSALLRYVELNITDEFRVSFTREGAFAS